MVLGITVHVIPMTIEITGENVLNGKVMAHSGLRNQKSVHSSNTKECNKFKRFRNLILVKFDVFNHQIFHFCLTHIRAKIFLP